jgi:hypothetical protein
MAIACLRDVTFFPDPPLRSVPSFRSCRAAATFSLLAVLYLRAILYLLPVRFVESR